MPRPRTVEQELSAASYETECRRIATYLRKKANGFVDLPVLAVMISPELAVWIAQRLENHADDVEVRLG